MLMLSLFFHHTEARIIILSLMNLNIVVKKQTEEIYGAERTNHSVCSCGDVYFHFQGDARQVTA